ncbi:hypothetical protein LCGC14_2917410 [marine sediment metagenome]|uniref:Uncharacterized protein n=1 Tax=marine sediment metagenome TaxID=412755 RepID=A0A0F8XQ14_9ZZZZ
MSLLGDLFTVAQFQSFSDADATSNVVVAAVTGSRIRVISYTINAANGENDVTFQSATTALSGAFEIANNATIHAYCAEGLFETAVGEAFNLLMSAATLVVGHFTYVLISE